VPTESAAPNPQVAGEVVTGLAVPWGIAFLPDGTALVGERDTGRLLRISPGSTDVVGTLEVRSRNDQAGQTGKLGQGLHPPIQDNR
jgi:glucose/arabinose dehydrogenase